MDAQHEENVTPEDFGLSGDNVQKALHFANYRVAQEQEKCAKAFEAEVDTWKAWPQAGAAKRLGVAAIRRGNDAKSL